MTDSNFDSTVEIPGSMFTAQNKDVKTAEQVLEAMQNDLVNDADWADKNIQATIELLQEWEGEP